MSTHPFPTTQRPRSIVDTLAALAAQAPDEVALTTLRDGEHVEDRATFGQLQARSLRIARALRARYQPGARVVLLVSSGVDFVGAFMGCLAAGMVAVPAYHPPQSRKVGQWKKLQAIVDNCGAELLVVPQRSLPALVTLKSQEGLFAACGMVTCDELDAQGGVGVALPQPAPHDLAFLQYTSGSTGLPKGVMITHGNILDNQEVIATLMGNHRHMRGGSWLPLYHDMGLSAVLQMLSVGCSLVLMSPVDFIQKPLRWMRAISDHRINNSGGPNFAYQLAATALASAEVGEQAIDLSSWNLAFCGAEPINPRTVSAFLAAAAPHGLDPKAFFPCYGMAEATVMVTGVGKSRGMRTVEVCGSELARGVLKRMTPGVSDARSLVSCGVVAPGHEVRIVGPDARTVPTEGLVGEIWVSGGSVGAGYHGNEMATADTFRAMLDGDVDTPWMRTGDLGALVDGELFITGRVKDMLIIRGRNLYPQDVEDAVQDSVPELRRGCGAAFSVTVDQQERLVLVQEIGRTQRRTMDMGEALRRMVVALNEDFGLTPSQIVLVEPATIEKTSSGKIARALCRQAYLQGQLRSVATWTEGQPLDIRGQTPPGQPAAETDTLTQATALRRDVESRIVQVAAEFLRVDASRVPRTTPWAELGFDSVNALQLSMKIQKVTGLTLDDTVLWDCANIEELAAYIAGMKGAEQALASAPGLPSPALLDAAPTPAAGASASVDASASMSDGQSLIDMTDAQAEALLMKELAR